MEVTHSIRKNKDAPKGGARPVNPLSFASGVLPHYLIDQSMPLQKAKIPIRDDVIVEVSGLVVGLRRNHFLTLVHLTHSLFQLWNGEDGNVSMVGHVISDVPRLRLIVLGLSII